MIVSIHDLLDYKGVNVIIECNQCRKQKEISLKRDPDSGECYEKIMDILDKSGWIVFNENAEAPLLEKHICPACAEEK